MVKVVAPLKPFEWDRPFESRFAMDARLKRGRFDVVAVDCGMKQGILNGLAGSGMRVQVVPAGTCPGQRAMNGTRNPP